MNIKIEDLKKNPNNPRIIKDEGFKKLKESLQSSKGKEHFDARPCIVSTRTGENIIIAGNTRFQAAKELGWKEVPTVIMEGLTEEQEQEIIIRDNVSNGECGWHHCETCREGIAYYYIFCGTLMKVHFYTVRNRISNGFARDSIP